MPIPATEAQGDIPLPRQTERVSPRSNWRSRSIEGFVLGVLCGMIGSQLGILTLQGHLTLLTGAAGAIIGLSRARYLLRGFAVALCVIILLVAYSPLVAWLRSGLERSDVPRQCPAIAVLGSFAFKDQTLNSAAQERFLRGYELLRQGFAQRLIITRPAPPGTPWDQTVRRQMDQLGLQYPIDVVGPVRNTHDEAMQVAHLAQAQGWSTIILVTQPWHMRRAAAVFEKAGVKVVCVPCSEGGYDWATLNGPGDKLRCFRNWLHEWCGYHLYHMRGWV